MCLSLEAAATRTTWHQHDAFSQYLITLSLQNNHANNSSKRLHILSPPVSLSSQTEGTVVAAVAIHPVHEQQQPLVLLQQLLLLLICSISLPVPALYFPATASA